MKNLGLVLGLVGLVGVVWAGCGGDETNLPTLSSSGVGAAGGVGGSGSGSGGMETGAGGMTGASSSGNGSPSSSGNGSSSGNPMNVYDPNVDGPYTILELKDEDRKSVV